ncbi:MAG TPA: hypothetical protein VFW89_03170 [Gemmatimonadaceae bacterium]|nr:hypothetical protein [Gemmatimonadaceae bacterium]
MSGSADTTPRFGITPVWWMVVVAAWFSEALLAARFGPYDRARGVIAHTPLEWELRAGALVLTAVLLAVIAAWRPARAILGRWLQRWAVVACLLQAVVDLALAYRDGQWSWVALLVCFPPFVGLAWLDWRRLRKSAAGALTKR